MTVLQFNKLNSGDIIKGRGSRGAFRRIIRVSKKENKTFAITLKKIRPSWTNIPYTTYVENDSRNFNKVKNDND